MKVDLFHCCKRQFRGDDDLLQIMRCSSSSSSRVIKRDKIISRIDGGAEIELDTKDFLIKELVGKGSISEVFLLERKTDKQKFAGKFFKVNVCTQEFIRETEIMKSCSVSCPSIVRMAGIFTTPMCLIMDYYVNGSLSDALLEDRKNVDLGKQTEYPFLRRLGFILDMCRAVTELHQKNICHRDIATRNLLLSDDKQHVLLADFSLSRVVASPYQKQSTLTAIVPTESAPETFGQNIKSSGGKSDGRVYSLKSDIWSMGITMYEIIDKALCRGQNWKNLPSQLPKKCKPSKKVFDRIEDLWILILRCWRQRPEERPQSWDLEDRMQKLIDNPMNADIEQDCYITRFSDEKTNSAVSSYRLRGFSNCWSQSVLQTSSKIWEQEQMLSSRSLRLGSPPSTALTTPESTEILRNITKGPQIRMLPAGKKTWEKRKQWHETSKGTTCEESSREHLKANMPRYSFNTNLSTPSLVRNSPYGKIDQINKNKSDPLNPNYNRKVNKGSKFLKRLGSLTTMFSTGTSLEEIPITPGRVGYCSPLDISFKSSATNIAYCDGRRFFSGIRTPHFPIICE